MDDLRAKLRAKGLTPRKLAILTGLSEDYIHRILSRKQQPKGQTMTRITAASKGAIRWSDIFKPINTNKPQESGPTA